MDRIDKTIISKLQEINCPLNGVKTLLEFDDENYSKAVFYCLRFMNIEPTMTCDSFPKSTLKRLQMSTMLAAYLRCELKYPHELSYQNLLYFELNDSRKLFLFLLEKITNLRAQTLAGGSPDACRFGTDASAADELELHTTRERSQNEVSLLKNQLEMKTKVESNLNALLNEIKIKSHTSRLFMPNSDDQFDNLRAITANDETRLADLKTKWSANEMRLLQKLDSLKTQNKTTIVEQHLENLNEMRSKLEKKLSEKKMALEDAEYNYGMRREGEHKAMDREMFTTQIIEITKNMKKQTSEIEKIASDTRRLQKDLSQTEGQLVRMFALFEQTIRQVTNRTLLQNRRVAIKSHQLFMNVHSNFEEIFRLIERTGRCERDILDYDEQIEREKRDNLTQKLLKAKNDLERFCTESKWVSC